MGGRAGVLTLFAVVALAVGVALSGPAPAAAEEAPFLDWNPLLPSFATPYHPSRERDCVDGANSCVEGTLSEMYRRFDRRYVTCDHNSAFGITYIRVTEAIRRTVLKNDLYVEPKYLNHEDKVFARMYFTAFDNWARGDRKRVPPAWLEALDSGRKRDVSGQGNLLMSMNAHINRDMPFMLDALGLTDPKGASRKPDHDRGNRVLAPLYDDVLRELAARYDPTVDDLDAPGTLYDDTAIFQILQGWREGVWRNAELLSAAQTLDQRRAAAEFIENYALGIARMIKSGTTISDSSARDAHCAAYRRTHRERGGKAAPRIAKRGLRARRGGIVRIRVRCDEPVRDCAGSLALTRRGRALARRLALSLRAGDSRVVRVRLSRRARRLVKRRKRLTVRVTALSPSPWGTTRSATATGRLKRLR
jgi:hypothetical protein